MKPFQYKLQAVQILRERRKNETMEHYALALARRAQSGQRLENAERQLSATRFELQELVTTGCPAHQINRQQSYCTVLQERRIQCDLELQAAERVVNQRLAEMLQARREREAVAKHHERSRSEYRQASQREEQKWLDDLTPRPGLAEAA